MGIDLYGLPLSAPCRAVLLGAKHMGVDVNLIPCNIMAGENMTPEFLKMNIQHTIPTMDDGGFYLTESRAMLQYLANAYGKNDSLYPKDAKKRALVDQRLLFDMGTLYLRFGDLYYPVIFQKVKFDAEKLKKFDDALGFLEAFLKATKYVAGDNLTIADFSIMATLSTAEACNKDFSKWPLIQAYMAKCKAEMTGYKEMNQDGADQFGGFAADALKNA
jgi:glutathione S-transferase